MLTVVLRLQGDKVKLGAGGNDLFTSGGHHLPVHLTFHRLWFSGIPDSLLDIVRMRVCFFTRDRGSLVWGWLTLREFSEVKVLQIDGSDLADWCIEFWNPGGIEIEFTPAFFLLGVTRGSTTPIDFS